MRPSSAWRSQIVLSRTGASIRDLLFGFVIALATVLAVHLGLLFEKATPTGQPAAVEATVVETPKEVYSIVVGEGLPALPVFVATQPDVVPLGSADIVLHLDLSAEATILGTFQDGQGARIPPDAVPEDIRSAAMASAYISKSTWIDDGLRAEGASAWKTEEIHFEELAESDVEAVEESAVPTSPVIEQPAEWGILDRVLSAFGGILDKADTAISFLLGFRELAAGATIAIVLSLGLIEARENGHLEALLSTDVTLSDVVAGRLARLAIAAVLSIGVFAILPVPMTMVFGDWAGSLLEGSWRLAIPSAATILFVTWLALPALLYVHLRLRGHFRLALATTAVLFAQFVVVGLPALLAGIGKTSACGEAGGTLCGVSKIAAWWPMAGVHAALAGSGVGVATAVSLAGAIVLGLAQYAVLYRTTGRPHMIPLD